MKQYKVIKEFPGLKVGDILNEDEGTGFFVNYKAEVDLGDDFEGNYINSVAINKAAIEENVGEYFEEIAIEEEPVTPTQERINEIMRVASYLEADLITAINGYHSELLGEMINRAYRDVAVEMMW